MKIAVLSDIHGNLPALQAVLDDLAHERPDAIVNLGDIASGPLLPAETLDLLMAHDFATIAGNHERQLLRARNRPREQIDPGTSDGFAARGITDAHAEWLRTLPATRWVAADILLVHGTPDSDLTYWLETVTPDFGTHGSFGIRVATAQEADDRLGWGEARRRASLVLCGHSHVPRAMQLGGTLVVNPGSVGLQAYDDHSAGYHQVHNDSPHARYAVVERRASGWQVRQCAVPYDWHAMGRLAAERGRMDWAYALATGRMPAATATITP